MKRFLFPALFLLAAAVPVRAADVAASTDTAVAAALDRGRALRLSSAPEWRALLHMARDVLFRHRSSIDDPDFFLSPRGRKGPQAELDATIRAFVANEDIDGEPAACRYPARYAFLKAPLNLPDAPTCGRYEEWKKKMAPTAVSLVFAGYYLNNPASMYGHTFLKLSRAGYEQAGPLLDYTVNYAATTGTTNGVLFAARGLLGRYRGRFSTDPYYVKIQKYNNMESRDLWEYALTLTPEQIDRLMRHLWELGGTSMSYWFFNKNCSYQLLPLLDVADPDLRLARHFRYRAIPLDTLRVVIDSPGLLAKRTMRPSHVRAMLARRALLTPAEIGTAEALVVDPSSAPVNAVTALPAARRALTLDSAYDLLRYRAGFYRVQPASVQERERRILELRRDIPPADAQTPELTFDAPAPEEGHGTGRLTAAVGADKKRGFQEIGVRASLHDLEANPVGYIPGSQLEMFNIRLRRRENSVYLEDAKLFEIVSLSPWDRWVRKPSWTVRADAGPAYDLGKSPARSVVGGIDGGSGVTVAALPHQALLLYALGKGDVETGNVLVDGYRAGLAAQAGALLRENKGARLHVSGTVTRFFLGDVSNRVELRAVQSVDLAKNVEARLTALRNGPHQEATASVNLYW